MQGNLTLLTIGLLGLLLVSFVDSTGTLHAQQGGGQLAELRLHSKDGDSVLAQSINTNLKGDIVASGVGLRGIGEGDIVISGIPQDSNVVRALLYWATIGSHGIYSSPTLNGSSVNGELIGTGPDTCWGALNNFVYRADVTSVVDGNGVYSLTGLPAAGPTIDDSQGATLLVLYSNPMADQRTIVVNDGATVVDTINGPLEYMDTLTGFAASSPPNAQVTFLVGDGQIIWQSGTIDFNGAILGTDHFFGTDGDYWDTLTYDVSALSPVSPSTARIIGDEDCLLWAATILSVAGFPAITSPVDGRLRTTGVENPNCVNDPELWTFCQHQTGFHRPLGGVSGADDTYAWDINLIGNADAGRRVFPVAPGRIARYGGACLPCASAGALLVEHRTSLGEAWWSGYLHMVDIPSFSEGDEVTTATVLGRIGGTGATNDHLHLVVYQGENVAGGLESFNATFRERIFTDGFESGDVNFWSISFQ